MNLDVCVKVEETDSCRSGKIGRGCEAGRLRIQDDYVAIGRLMSNFWRIKNVSTPMRATSNCRPWSSVCSNSGGGRIGQQVVCHI